MTTWSTYASGELLGPVYTQDDDTGIPGSPFVIPDPDDWPATTNPHARLHWDGSALYYADPRTTGEKQAAVRAERDALLTASDWRVLRALEAGESVTTGDWHDYRQALRDIPDDPEFPDDVTFPDEPT